jgi:hypothetical protein
MTWIDTINQLQYYHQPKGVPCYCDIIVFPSDLMLQGAFGAGSGSYTITIELMKADGTLVYENITSYFEYHFAVNQFTQQHFFNARLKAFATSMCTHACYILHVKVMDGSAVVFDKYTERYCQSSCCDLARDIDIRQDGILIGGMLAGGGGTTTTETATTTPINPKLTECGDALITLRTKFDCFDKFTGTYYGRPKDVLSGMASFTYQVITNMRGRIVRRPREVKREYSYNCRLQRVESTATYLLEGFEYFPPWKMQELEAQLHATEIYVDDVRYEYAGDVPMQQIHDCVEIFKLETLLNDCTIRQVFGCGNDCEPEANFDGAQKMFVIPDGYEGQGFYSESKQLIASSYDELLNYFRNLNGITAVNDISITTLDCMVYKAFSLSGTAYVPTSFYYDKASSGNRVFGTVLPSLEDICAQFGNICVKPVIAGDDIVIAEQVCAAPVLDTATITEMEESDIAVNAYGDWTITEPDTTAGVYNNQVRLSLYVSNALLPEDPSAPGEPLLIEGAIIAVIGASGRPRSFAILNEHNSNMPEGSVLHIDINGLVRYYGYTTTTGATGSTIELDNLTYNI